MNDEPSPPSGQWPVPSPSPILWAFYLACSWTWCIGMFLPVLLLRDAGWMGYLVFFVPNVIGAAAMGFVLRSPEQAAGIIQRHGATARVFSVVTLAFHAFWLAWIFSLLRDAFPIPDTWMLGAAGAGIVWIVASGRFVRAGAAARVAPALWLVGLVILVAVLLTPGSLLPRTGLMTAAPASPQAAGWIMPACVFGFLLCPYLDLTFLLARRSLPGARAGRVAFGVGFGVFFPVMIALTAVYAGPLIAVLEGRAIPVVAPWAGAAIIFHILAQWVFTVRLHIERLYAVTPAPARVGPDEVNPVPDGATARSRSVNPDPLGVTLMACLGAAGLGILAPNLPAHSGMSAGEIIYRVFLSAYALVFPVYVWARMIPRRRTPTHAAWICACVLASPFYWMGFIEREGVWLAPGILIALVAPLLWRERLVPDRRAQP